MNSDERAEVERDEARVQAKDLEERLEAQRLGYNSALENAGSALVAANAHAAGLEEEIVKLRTGLARLAFKLGLAEHVPGKPGREAPFEELEKAARANERGWNALIGVLMDESKPADAPCSHCECLDAHGR